ncbi:MAG TPA: hypothetical protein VHT27_03945 [Solirubrobacteraceae bacterium]|nr:hypothetical protein [Solirubrobacteraceae bacterium]
MTVAELWRRGQRGWPRNYPLAQFPNLPLAVAFGGWGLAAVAADGAHEVGRAVFAIGFGVWAWEEAAGGVNLFRRVLGAAALVWIVVDLTGEL